MYSSAEIRVVVNMLKSRSSFRTCVEVGNTQAVGYETMQENGETIRKM